VAEASAQAAAHEAALDAAQQRLASLQHEYGRVRAAAVEAEAHRAQRAGELARRQAIAASLAQVEASMASLRKSLTTETREKMALMAELSSLQRQAESKGQS
jgi:hypothetical protein